MKISLLLLESILSNIDDKKLPALTFEESAQDKNILIYPSNELHFLALSAANTKD